jgi:ketosteroid isomerase-like protein
VSETTTDAKAVALELLATLDRQDFDALREQLTETATWTMMAPSLDPPALEGRDAIVAFFGAGDQVFVDGAPKITIGRVVAEGDHVAIEGSGTGPLHNGNTYDNRYHFAIDVQDGRVAAVREYMDSHHVAVTMPPPPGS